MVGTSCLGPMCGLTLHAKVKNIIRDSFLIMERLAELRLLTIPLQAAIHISCFNPLISINPLHPPSRRIKIPIYRLNKKAEIKIA